MRTAVSPLVLRQPRSLRDALKMLRVSRAAELEGLDMPEMGSIGYPKDFEPEPGAEVFSRKRSHVSAGVIAAAGK